MNNEALNICNEIDKKLWELHNNFRMKNPPGIPDPLFTIMFRPESFADFKYEMSRYQFTAMSLGSLVADRYRDATIGIDRKQQEPFRIVER